MIESSEGTERGERGVEGERRVGEGRVAEGKGQPQLIGTQKLSYLRLQPVSQNENLTQC